MEHDKHNYIELFNEFSILLCAYLMNVFLEGVAPATFMTQVGWAFMSFSIFNILINVVCLILDQIYESALLVRNKKALKEKMRIVVLRLQNLKTINKHNKNNLSYIQ